MKFTNTKIPEVKIIEPEVFEDKRGLFFESFIKKKMEEEIGQEINFVQENHSKSYKGVLRGLHYQLPPFAQDKLINVIKGTVFDVAVDIRKFSPTFGHWIGETLSSDNKKQLWIPKGFAHGFITLSETAECLYKTTQYYAPNFERAIRWDDPDIGINWFGAMSPLLSPKDEAAKILKDATVFD